VSSILEALRELEGTKPSSQRSRAAWAAGETEERPPIRRAAELLGIVAFGLAIGGAGFTAILWLWPSGETAPRAHAPAPAAAAAGRSASPATPAAPAPAWLDRMGPPRGRVDGAESTRSAGPGDAAAAPRGAGLSLVSVRYDDSRAGRSATLRIDGSPVVLREGETAHGIELQLVTPTGAYVRRGGEVLMLETR
jgi:hypothetical protein